MVQIICQERISESIDEQSVDVPMLETLKQLASVPTPQALSDVAGTAVCGREREGDPACASRRRSWNTLLRCTRSLPRSASRVTRRTERRCASARECGHCRRVHTARSWKESSRRCSNWRTPKNPNRIQKKANRWFHGCSTRTPVSLRRLPLARSIRKKGIALTTNSNVHEALCAHVAFSR